MNYVLKGLLRILIICALLPVLIPIFCITLFLDFLAFFGGRSPLVNSYMDRLEEFIEEVSHERMVKRHLSQGQVSVHKDLS